MISVNNLAPHFYEAMVRESQVDFHGHMNNVAYLQVFESALWDMFTDRGYGLDRIQEIKKGPVIVSLGLEFTKEVILRNRIVVETRYLSYEGKIGQILQEMKSESESEPRNVFFEKNFCVTAESDAEDIPSYGTLYGKSSAQRRGFVV